MAAAHASASADDTTRDHRHDASASTGERARALGEIAGTLVLVGAGKMGGAMLEGWLALGLDPATVVVLEPQPAPEISALAARGLRLNPALDTAAEAAAIVIAVKPQVAPEVVPALAPLVGRAHRRGLDHGRPHARLPRRRARAARRDRARHAEHAGRDRPRHHGRGAERARVAAQRELVHALLRRDRRGRMGRRTKRLMDAVTAVSGSGPAYVFLLAESLARAGAAAGLPADLAARLARATVAGSGELLHRSPLDAATLRQNVTSPGGTTAAALDVLMGRTASNR